METRAEHHGGERGGRGACAACGSEPRRAGARYCSTCGRTLGQDYFPTDSLRASYRFGNPPAAKERPEGPLPVAPAGPRPVGVGVPERRPAPRPRTAARPAAAVQRGGREVNSMRPKDTNGAATTALAFATYALVPYVGILFCPGALLAGGFGLLRSYRAPHAGGRRTSATALALGLLILCVQLLLWWILYKVPEWSRSTPF